MIYFLMLEPFFGVQHLLCYLCFLELYLPPLPFANSTSIHLCCLTMNPMCHLHYNGLV